MRGVTRFDVYIPLSTHLKLINFDTTTRPRTPALADVYVVGVTVVARIILAPVSAKTEMTTPSYEVCKLYNKSRCAQDFVFGFLPVVLPACDLAFVFLKFIFMAVRVHILREDMLREHS